MKKCIVVVNQQYLVLVEAASPDEALGLPLWDELPGVDICEAFDPADLDREYFGWLVGFCETVSLDELMTIFSEK